jgi:hypothetical protein
MNKNRSSSCLVALFVFALMPAFGQQTGDIRGVVIDDAKSPLPGVSITAKSPGLQGLRTAVTDEKGQFRLPLLPIGLYSLNFEFPGFEKMTLTDQQVRLGFTVSLSIILKPASISKEITVVAPTPLIDKTKADNSYRLNSDDLERLPTQARTIAEVVSFTPGVTGVRANTVTGGSNQRAAFLGVGETGLPSFRGEGDSGNDWLVDGLSMKGVMANDPAIRINYDSWEEVQVIADGFAPGLGNGLGGFINIVTKTGGNEFHGEGGSLLRGSQLRAQRHEQLSVASLPETSLSQYYANLGGPILKDKLWFFLSDNYYRSLDITEDQAVGWLTIPAGKRRFTTNDLFGKATLTPLKDHTLSFSGTLDTSLGQSGGIGVPATYEKTGYTDHSYRLNYRGILSSATLLTAAWGQFKRDSLTEPSDGDYGPPNYFWQDIVQSTNNSSLGIRAIQRRTDASFSLTHYMDAGHWGSHEIQAGMTYYQNNYDYSHHATGLNADPWPGNGFDNGISIDWEGPGVPLNLNEFGPGEQHNRTKGFGLFIGDQFTVSRFSVMLGLRADTQRLYSSAGRLLWSWGLGDFLAPRFSLAFDLLGDGRNILKFGYGRFAVPHSISYLQWLNEDFVFTARGYGWVGGDNPTDVQLTDPSNWAFQWEQSANAMPTEVDPQLKPNRTTRFLLEFDRRLGPDWALKIRGIISYARNQVEDILLYDPETQWVKYLYTNFELRRRDYRGLEVELTGKVADKIRLNATYTWSQAKGTASGNFYEQGTWSSAGGTYFEWSLFGDHPYVPEGEPNKELIDQLFQGYGGRGIGDEGWYGFLPYSVNHAAKMLGSYFAPYGIVISSGIEYVSGYHWEKKGLDPNMGYFLFPEGRGGRTTPAHMYVDLLAEKDFHLRRGPTLAIGLNVYNFLNSQRPVSFVKEDTALFGQVWARQLPRWAQLKIAFRF